MVPKCYVSIHYLGRHAQNVTDSFIDLIDTCIDKICSVTNIIHVRDGCNECV